MRREVIIEAVVDRFASDGEPDRAAALVAATVVADRNGKRLPPEYVEAEARAARWIAMLAGVEERTAKRWLQKRTEPKWPNVVHIGVGLGASLDALADREPVEADARRLGGERPARVTAADLPPSPAEVNARQYRDWRRRAGGDEWPTLEREPERRERERDPAECDEP